MQWTLTLEMRRARGKMLGCRVHLLDTLRLFADDTSYGIHDVFRHAGMKAQGGTHSDGRDALFNDPIGPSRQLGCCPAQGREGCDEAIGKWERFQGADDMGSLD
jgi:hypothetical protein